jgi:hypothetical protein
MALHRIPIITFSAQPDATGNVSFQPYNLIATNDVWRHNVLCFADSAVRDLLYGSFAVPKNYVGTPKIIVVWTTTATSGNAIFDFDYRAISGNDTESLDQAGTQEALTVTDAAPSAAHERMECEMAMTAGNLAVDDTVEYLFARDGASSDTIAATVMVFGLFFEYADA